MNASMEMSSLIELCKLRREKPEEYKIFLEEATMVIREIAIIAAKVMDEIKTG